MNIKKDRKVTEKKNHWVGFRLTAIQYKRLVDYCKKVFGSSIGEGCRLISLEKVNLSKKEES